MNLKHTITFTVTFTDTTATFTVHADKAISGNNGAKLDGNQNPAGTNGVGPNGDDYVFYQAVPSVGGIKIPVDEFGLLAPYIGLVLTIIAATVATAIYFKRVKHRKEEQ